MIPSLANVADVLLIDSDRIEPMPFAESQGHQHRAVIRQMAEVEVLRAEVGCLPVGTRISWRTELDATRKSGTIASANDYGYRMDDGNFVLWKSHAVRVEALPTPAPLPLPTEDTGMTATITCAGCGAEVERTGPRQTYCRPCAEARDKEQKRAYKERQKAKRALAPKARKPMPKRLDEAAVQLRRHFLGAVQHYRTAGNNQRGAMRLALDSAMFAPLREFSDLYSNIAYWRKQYEPLPWAPVVAAALADAPEDERQSDTNAGGAVPAATPAAAPIPAAQQDKRQSGAPAAAVAASAAQAAQSRLTSAAKSIRLAASCALALVNDGLDAGSAIAQVLADTDHAWAERFGAPDPDLVRARLDTLLRERGAPNVGGAVPAAIPPPGVREPIAAEDPCEQVRAIVRAVIGAILARRPVRYELLALAAEHGRQLDALTTEMTAMVEE